MQVFTEELMAELHARTDKKEGQVTRRID